MDATCTKSGLTEGKHCGVCGKVLAKQDVIEATGHIETVYDIAPTCTETGLTGGGYCSVCDVTIAEPTIAVALGHAYSDNACTVCDHSITPSTGLAFRLLDDGTYTVTGKGSCTDNVIVIPANYKGQKVTGISSSAFKSLSLKGVYIPGTVTSIGISAFEHASIDFVYMEEGVQSVGQSAFAGNYGCKKFIFIPSTLSSVGREAFMCGTKCVVINSPYVARNVTTYDSMGYILYHSQSVLVRNGLTYGGYVNTVGGTYSSTHKSFPEFMGNEYICFGKHEAAYHSYENYSILDWEGMRCTSCYSVADFKEITLDISAAEADSVTAHLYKENGKTILRISGNGNIMSNPPISPYKGIIEEIIIEEGILSIPNYAFENMLIESIVIPDSVTSIGYDAFDTSSLKKITLGSGVEKMTGRAFGSNSAVTEISVSSSNPFFKTANVALFSKDGKTLVKYFSEDTETSYSIPDGVATVGEYAFYNSKNLTEITIPSSVTTIGYGAFEYCANIKNVFIPITVTTISRYAFNSANTVVFCAVGSKPDGWQYDWCGSCKVFFGVLDSGVTSNGLSWLLTADGVEIWAYSGSASSVEIPATINGSPVVSIYDRVFENNTAVAGVTIPDSVVSLGEYMFSGCSSLVSVTLSDNITSIPKCTFYSCKSLRDIIIPDSVTMIGDSVFYGCTKLETVTLTASSELKSIGEDAFFNCTLLKSITIPETVTDIYEYAFYNCSGLTSITIPKSVTSIGSYAFYGCSSLTSVFFEDTSAWYRTTSFSDWVYMKNGTSTSMADELANATYFKSTYKNYYWYKR